MKASQPEAGLYRVQVLDRAVAILQVLADSEGDLGPAQIANTLGLHKSTIHRLLAVLEQHSLVTKTLQNGKYSLGLRLFELGNRAVARLDLGRHAQPLLERLAAETGETAHVCVLDNGEMVSVASAESPQTVRTPMTLGRRTPLHCTSVGKAMLAFLPERTVDELLRGRSMRAYTRHTLTTRIALLGQLVAARQRGYTVDDEEIEDGLRCVGAPVWNYSGTVVAAISIAGPAFRISKDRIPALARSVSAAADELSMELGYRPSSSESRREAGSPGGGRRDELSRVGQLRGGA